MAAASVCPEPGAIADWIAAQIAGELGLSDADIDRGVTFFSLGLGSQAAAALAGRLGRHLGRPVPVALLWAHPTVDGLAAALVEEPGEAGTGTARPAEAVLAEPVAVVSMAVRLPGADDLAELWDLVLAGGVAIGPPPPGRFPERTAPLPHAGYLRQGIDAFDHRFFRLSPRETADLDPVQRLFLEVCWEAVEASSLPRAGLAGSATGVYAGSIWSEHGAATRPGRHTVHTATGSSLSMVANRVSYLYDLRGPSVTLDSACSSSLVAVHLAAQALRLREIDAAVVGGVNLLQSTATTDDLVAFGGLAPDGRSKAFAASADGFGRGEGAVALVLKRLSDAERDGDHIWCLVHGTAVNNDGHTNGLTAPSPLAQQAVIQEAHVRGGTDPSRVRYVETHGTGTALGDPIEATALSDALGGGRDTRHGPVHLGTLKANIGHLEGAAGAAGLVKAALVMHHGLVPPCVLSGGTNPHIDLAALNLDLPTATVGLPAGEPVLGGVSSFGWGGTNAHVVVGPYVTGKVPAPASPAAATPRAAGAPLFAFSPFGGQWQGMGRELLWHDPEFRAAVAECDRGAAPVLGRSLLELLASGADPDAYGVAVSQPAVYAVQVGLARSLAARGVRPATVVGHSLGEIAGAVAAGALTAREGGRVVAHYAAAQQRLTGRGGGMAVVALSVEELTPHLAARPDLVVAGRSSLRSTNVSGPESELDNLVEELTALGHRASRINVGLAAHGPAVDEVRDDLVGALGTIEQYPPELPVVSALDGRVMEAGDFTAAYFARALREPVDFAGALTHPLVQNREVLVEINSHPILGTALRETAGDHARVLAACSRSGDHLTEVADACAAVPTPVDTLLTLSAHTPAALARRCRDVAQWWPGDRTPADVAPALAQLSTLPYRVGVVAAGRHEAVARLREQAEALEAGGAAPVARGRVRTAFVFPGQGGQWQGMGRDLYAREPVFARHVRRCDEAFRQACGLEVLPLLLEDTAEETFTDVATAQPLLFTVQVALARTLEHYGVVPHAVVGHSMGEAAAAHLAGALSLRDAAAVIGRRTRLMRDLAGTGAMLATELTLPEAEALCAGTPAMSVAVSNSARSTVLSGDAEVIARTARELTGRGVFNRPVRVQVASHSPQMDPILSPLVKALTDVSPRPAGVPFHSTVLGRVAEGTELDAAYWARNLRAPVLFADATARLLDDGFTCFVEISPHAVLSPSVEETAAGRDVVVVPVLRKQQPEWPELLAALGRLHGAGVEIDLAALNPPCRNRPVPLPYPWERVATPVPRATPGGAVTGAGPLGVRTEVPHDPALAVHAGRLDTVTWSLGDHVVAGRNVLPAAVFAAAAAHVARPVLGTDPLTVRDLQLPVALEVPDAGTPVQTTIRATGADSTDVTFFGRDEGAWTPVATATVERVGAVNDGDVPALRPRTGEEVPAEALYAEFAVRGLAFGPEYRRLHRPAVGASGATARITWDPRHSDPVLPVDPRVLDAALQVAAAPLLTGPGALDAGWTLVSTAAREVTFLAVPGAEPVATAALTAGPEPGTWFADVDLADEAGGAVAVRVRGMELRAVPASGPLPGADTDTGEAPAAPGQELRALPAAERAERLVVLVRQVVGEVAGLPPAQVDPDEPFHSLGMNSIMGLELRNRLERLLGTALSPTVVWNHPTAEALAAELAGRLEPAPDTGTGAQAAPAAPAATEAVEDAEGSDLDALRRELEELQAMVGEL
ncbi:acyltransferase domain-containing protein [Streptomyces triculaminicus]|uniref:acyltransferase domain-containing protein n=1 Tax=Streptomyces triculaminicus TaxID=2816232 RepID=UPI0033C2A1A4